MYLFSLILVIEKINIYFKLLKGDYHSVSQNVSHQMAVYTLTEDKQYFLI